MPFLRYSHREISLKIVYYGPPGAGKLTNLLALKEAVGTSFRSELKRSFLYGCTLYSMEYEPVCRDKLYAGGKVWNLRTTLNLIQEYEKFDSGAHKTLLKGVDGVVFVVTSDKDEIPRVREYWDYLLDNLHQNRLQLTDIGIVVQVNKQDEDHASALSEFKDILSSFPEGESITILGASAIKRQGVVQSLETCIAEAIPRCSPWR